MEKNKKFERKKFNLNFIFSNNKILFLVAFLLAFILWLFFSQNSTAEETTTTIYDIPVSIELSEQAQNDGLKIYRGLDTTAAVQIKGNRITVGTVTKDDIQVTAQETSAILSPSTSYALSLSARKNSSKSDYEIVSVSPNVVNIYVDRERQKEFTIENRIDTTNLKIPTGYYLAKPVLSTDKITVTGPETEVKKIDKIVVRDTVDGEQTSNITRTETPVLLDSEGEEINSDLLVIQPEAVDATIRILPKKELSVTPVFKNVPSGIDVNSIASVSPSTISIAGPADTINALTEIQLEPIDFSKISPDAKEQKLNLTLPDGCISISNEDQATITYNLDGYSSTSVHVTSFTKTGIQDGFDATVSTSGLYVNIAGPTDTLDTITSDNIIAQVDLTSLGNGFVGEAEVPVKISIVNAEKCWSYKEYTANVYVYKKNS